MLHNNRIQFWHLTQDKDAKKMSKRRSEKTLPPKIGLTKLPPILALLGVARPAFEAGIEAGIFPRPRVPSRKPGCSALWDSAQIWAVVGGLDWREANSASLQTNDD